MQTTNSRRSRSTAQVGFHFNPVATACALLMAASGAANAQQTEAPAAKDAAPLNSVVVVGIRSSLESSLNLKRDGQGIVDGISAEDIGKFPDTNLAESLQRISGVSIDRSIGEGSKVTVRGVGPEFNMVLLNGRQMPASSIADTGPSNSRAFDFANLASEAVAGIEVYKTSRASTPTGGIGATINIKTARPLDNPGLHANFGVKGVVDTSNSILPEAMKGRALTPEVSGIYSNTFADGKFGVALTGSYQDRNLGYNQAAVGGGWIQSLGNAGQLASPSKSNPADITNKPAATDLYALPQNLIYSVNGVQRQRTNGQLALQFAPTKELKTTLDFTYSENKIQNKRNELSAWFNFGPGSSSWTDGPIASPKFYSETIGVTNSPLSAKKLADLAMAGAEYATKAENKSVGFNVEWKASSKLKLEFDAHRSTAESGADSPFGTNAVIGAASYNRATTAVDFTRSFPVLSIYDTPADASLMRVAGSSFRNSYMLAQVEQAQIKGAFKLTEDSRLDFGVGLNTVNNRSAYSDVTDNDWDGNQSKNSDYPDSVWRPDTIRQYFSKISGSNSPSLYNNFFTFDFKTIRDLAIKATGNEARFTASGAFATDRTVVEKSQSGYLQYNKDWDTAMPMNTAIGWRYEKTNITSSALVPTATGVTWDAANEYTVQKSGTGFTTLLGSYSYLLPSIDLNIDVTDQTKFRASYGESIGRPGWGDIQGGQTLTNLARQDGGTGAQGNANLKPLKSRNLDFSLEWYYAKSSYAAIGYFRKNIDNYIGVTQFNDTPFNLHTPYKGSLWQEAVANRCGDEDASCIRTYIFEKYDGKLGVDKATQKITGQPNDPILGFQITAVANQRSAALDGWELNLQHMFGTTGFGMSANYTIVNSGLKYDNSSLGEQFALEGLSNSANLVGFYENDKWQVRAAYNWRGEFLSGRFDAKGPNPAYTEAYGQLDINMSYNWDKRLTLQAEVINATDGIQRVHGRTKEQVLYVGQTGPRYMFGARYKF
jgi:TonB-dependent receptor